MDINQNQALFSLLGTQFGGDGRTNFALPDMRGRVPIHAGNGHAVGEKGGTEAVLLDATTMPGHTHAIQGADRMADAPSPANTVVADPDFPYFGGDQDLVSMQPSVTSTGDDDQAHPNMQPYQVVNFCIALTGIFPSRS